jgi:putative transcriptional regulator
VVRCDCKASFTIGPLDAGWNRRCSLKNRIEEIRKARGILQEEFAKSMGVSRQTISSLENGRYNPSILLAHKIARYFEMAIEDVFIFEEE